jgi:hypothetical protein
MAFASERREVVKELSDSVSFAEGGTIFSL